jgi:hypothetical protein
MNKSIWKIKFDSIEVSCNEPLFKQILWVSFYEWDETPYGLTIRILGINIDFLIGKWIEE